MDPLRVAEAITPHTRAVVPVHFGGQPCSMEAIRELAQRHGLKVIEDAAHAHGSSYQDKKCGSLGDLGSFSFQASKNMTAGEGGIITTNDPSFAEACDMLVWAGRKIGQPWYKHYTLAGNARMTEFQGALLLSQLARLEKLNRRRSENARLLDEMLNHIQGIRPTSLRPTTTQHSYHLYMFRYDPATFAGLPKALRRRAAGRGIDGRPADMHPLYANPMFVEKSFMGGVSGGRFRARAQAELRRFHRALPGE
jgi:dTDP-4-amino-4,6-dideoxygalactose transaminase